MRAAALALVVMPAELSVLQSRKFVAVILNPRCEQLSKFWSAEDLDEIEREHRELCQGYSTGNTVKTLLLTHTEKIAFNDCTSKPSCAGFVRSFTTILLWFSYGVRQYGIGGVRFLHSEVGNGRTTHRTHVFLLLKTFYKQHSSIC